MSPGNLGWEMSRRRSRHRSRRPRTNVQGSRDAREHHERSDRHPTVDGDPLVGQHDVGIQDLEWHNVPWTGDATAGPHSGNSVADTYAFSDPAVRPDSAAQGAADVPHRMANSNRNFSDLTLREPAWDWSPTTYQLGPYSQGQALMSPTIPQDETSSTHPEFTSPQTGPNPSLDYQTDLAWAVSMPQDFVAEIGIPSEQRLRRWSTQARQGSDVGLPGAGHSGNAAALISTNQSEIMEEHDSSGSSGNTTPLHHDHFVYYCMRDEETQPWSPENPRRNYGHGYPQ